MGGGAFVDQAGHAIVMQDGRVPLGTAMGGSCASELLPSGACSDQYSMASPDDCGPPPSRGSEGHPLYCHLPCKYAKSQRGCKEGAACTFCHVCQWWRGLRSAKGKALEIARRSE